MKRYEDFKSFQNSIERHGISYEGDESDRGKWSRKCLNSADLAIREMWYCLNNLKDNKEAEECLAKVDKIIQRFHKREGK